MSTNTSREIAQHPPEVAAFFDLDKTIIATSSAYVYGKEFLNSGLISPAEALHMSMSKASYMFSGHSSEQMDATRDHLSNLVTGWDVEQIRTIANETMHSVVTPTIYAEARALIADHKAAGHDVVIISASARVLVEPIAKELGVATVIATELEEENGKFTGNISFYCKGDAKAEAILSLATRNNYDLSKSYAYSDSATDLPMLQLVGFPNAVNPDRALRRTAIEKNWTIHAFRNPIPLIPLPSGKDISIGTGVVAGIAALTAGIWWWMRTKTPTT
ncbi:hypothetical protein CMUST_14685 [Corynebacterium mustelae]|uniref:HAD-superfamily subfamily IB hydrolase, TIGR01490 n=1 Tax=Corynebacterium mustelae TaxID=571915 RepID=A0A0G3H3B4_9CORY|nr:HAD family hydrolase [Corynebacterium mustelae]AKK07230.1 hypothetical protein CMUST_14685 [Corynebacterium mustelae]